MTHSRSGIDRRAAAPVVLVAAVARNGVIGSDNRLAWHIPEDMVHFKSLTTGATVIMGRSTWQSIPERFRPLPGRRNIVLSRQGGFVAPGAQVLPSLAQALASALEQGDGPARPVFIIGGAQVYAAALPVADRMELTEIDHDFPGDAHFPDWPRDQFRQTATRRLHAAAPNDFDIAFVTYDRVRSPNSPHSPEGDDPARTH